MLIREHKMTRKLSFFDRFRLHRADELLRPIDDMGCLCGIPGRKGHEDLGGFVVLERDKLQILSEDEDPKP